MSRRLALVLTGAALVVACDSGPSGPGTLTVTVAGPSQQGAGTAPRELGAVVVEVLGSGIEGFEGLGTTQAYGAVVSAAEQKHRVLLINQETGDIHFGIRMRDVTDHLWAVTVVLAADSDDVPMLPTGIEVRVEPPR